ncbi:MAG TPA: serine/threonine-protein kinase [Chthoniobacterales bacterium]|nr:serine/threonine-protein kinase [Chthoniobacterales bacterium]
MSGEAPAPGLDVTIRDFNSGQKVFSRYTLIKTLGRGGMGVVWLARDDELERNVALKFLPELIVHDRAVLGDMKRETRRSLDLTHKNIVRIYDFVHSEQSGCISMEYIDGDTLSNLRADKQHKVFEPHELEEWTSQLCDALDYAHNHARIIHRDLKPANLMVNQRGDLKVSDFGISRSLSDSVSMLTMERGRSGTLVFMSPQQLDGERGTPADDIYSFGATMYELITSKPPFSSGNVDRQIREKIPPLMGERRKDLEVEGEMIDDTWEKVIASCLAKDPARRPQSFVEIAERLEIASPKTVRAARAIQPPTMATVPVPVPTPSVSPGTATTSTLPPLPKTGGLSAGKLALILGGVGALVFFFLVALGIWYFVAKKSTPKTTAVTPTSTAPASTLPAVGAAPDESALGGVILKTTPKGATVTLGGMEAGKSPVTFKGIKAGKYPLRISLDGYEPVEREVEVKPGQFVDLGTIVLVRGSGMANTAKDVNPFKSDVRPGPSTPPKPPVNQDATNAAPVVPFNDFTGG